MSTLLIQKSQPKRDEEDFLRYFPMLSPACIARKKWFVSLTVFSSCRDAKRSWLRGAAALHPPPTFLPTTKPSDEGRASSRASSFGLKSKAYSRQHYFICIFFWFISWRVIASSGLEKKKRLLGNFESLQDTRVFSAVGTYGEWTKQRATDQPERRAHQL